MSKPKRTVIVVFMCENERQRDQFISGMEERGIYPELVSLTGECLFESKRRNYLWVQQGDHYVDALPLKVLVTDLNYDMECSLFMHFENQLIIEFDKNTSIYEENAVLEYMFGGNSVR
jgi:hypothetical protein